MVLPKFELPAPTIKLPEVLLSVPLFVNVTPETLTSVATLSFSVPATIVNAPPPLNGVVEVPLMFSVLAPPTAPTVMVLPAFTLTSPVPVRFTVATGPAVQLRSSVTGPLTLVVPVVVRVPAAEVVIVPPDQLNAFA